MIGCAPKTRMVAPIKAKLSLDGVGPWVGQEEWRTSTTNIVREAFIRYTNINNRAFRQLYSLSFPFSILYITNKKQNYHL